MNQPAIDPAPEPGPETTHGSVVRDAMTPGERRLTGILLVFNMALVTWMLVRADFSEVRPNAVDAAERGAPEAPLD